MPVVFHSGVSGGGLLSTTAMVWELNGCCFGTILPQERWHKTGKEQTCEEQAGFCIGRGCIHQIFSAYTYQSTDLPSKDQRTEHSEIHAAVNYIDRFALWNRLSRNRVHEMYESILKQLHRRRTSDGIKAYRQLLPLCFVNSGVGQDINTSPSPFEIIMGESST